DAFRHEALFYSREDDFVRQTSRFIRGGLAADEPVLVVVSGRKIQRLRSELGTDADRVRFADMNDVGRNPARIIPAWRDFVDEHAHTGRPLRGIGEPIFSSRTASEMVECELHEALLNVAFDGGPAWWLVCPYDTTALRPAILEEARRNHPFLAQGDRHHASAVYTGVDRSARPFDRPLPEPRGEVEEMPFCVGDLHAVREVVARHAAAFGLDDDRTSDFVLATDEIASNSIRHGGGSGRLRLWAEGDVLISEVRDAGRIVDPLVGRVRPIPTGEGGVGLWLATQLCDLVQVRTFATGSVVRLHTARP
ncbi:MAG TPA: sensor histidine kinase, partial [Actinomycetota bacterium]|nr:sensor histidine kinase [Actinomycetota bacterium]